MSELSISHFPQVPCKPFVVEVASVDEALKVADVLANYDLFQYDNRIKGDYANATYITLKIEDEDGEDELSFDPDNGYDVEELRDILKENASA